MKELDPVSAHDGISAPVASVEITWAFAIASTHIACTIVAPREAA